MYIHTTEFTNYLNSQIHKCVYVCIYLLSLSSELTVELSGNMLSLTKLNKEICLVSILTTLCQSKNSLPHGFSKRAPVAHSFKIYFSCKSKLQ